MSDQTTLVIGNKNYSSWSLRAYLVLCAAEIDFNETLIVLDTETSRAELLDASSSGKVPVLAVGDDIIWESLSIAEWAAERAPALWPSDARSRAHARSVSSEMHAGFAALRGAMPMNIRGRHPGVGHSTAALADIARVTALWKEAHRFGRGRFLYGDTFGVADAMYAPVATRLVTYGVELDDDARAYLEAVFEYEPMARWVKAASEETWECRVAEPGCAEWAGGPLAS